MTKPKKAPTKLQCPECPLQYDDARGLASHRRSKHGITGTSPAALAYRRKKHGETIALPEPVPVEQASAAEVVEPTTTQPNKRKYKKRRSLERAKQTLTLSSPDDHHDTQEENFVADRIPEAALALALGRFQELCRSIAFELDLPARMFTERVATFVYAAQVRQPSRSAMRVPPMR